MSTPHKSKNSMMLLPQLDAHNECARWMSRVEREYAIEEG